MAPRPRRSTTSGSSESRSRDRGSSPAAPLGPGDLPPHPCAIELLRGARAGRLLVVAAHPDDEAIGVGATLGALVASGWRTFVLHVTDGAPRDETLRPALRDRRQEDAAAIRRAEATAALRTGGLDDDVLLPALGVVDLEATLALVDVTRVIARVLASLDADVVVTHPYEGGHPDHDAVAFAVHGAVELHERAQPRRVRLAEMSSYHAERGRLVTARFLDCGVPRCHRRHPGALDDAARARRRRMLDAFESQTAVLASFGDGAEPLRCAPRYDFERAPHPGPLHYERLPFGWTGARWRAIARAAREELGLSGRRITTRSSPPRAGARG